MGYCSDTAFVIIGALVVTNLVALSFTSCDIKVVGIFAGILAVLAGLFWYKERLTRIPWEDYCCEACGADYRSCEHKDHENYTLVKKF